MKITQLAELLQSGHLTIDSSMGYGEPCTLYRGPAPAPAAPSQPPWTLHDQSVLRNNQDSRQALRKHVRMLVTSVGRDWVKAIAANEVHKNASNDASNGDANDAEAEQTTGGESGGGGSRKSASSTRGRGQKDTKRESSSKALKRKMGEDEDEDDEFHGNDSDGDRSPAKKKSKATKSTMKRRLTPKQESPSQQNSQGEASTVDLVSELLQSNDLDLKNARRIAKVLESVHLSRQVRPANIDPSEVHLSSILSRQPMAGRNVQPAGRSKRAKDSVWLFNFKEGNKKLQEWRVPYSTLPVDSPKAMQEELHAELARQHNHWPWGPDTLKGTKMPLRLMLITAAAQRLWAKPAQLDEVYHSDSILYQTRVHYIDQATGAHKRLTVSATASENAMAGVIVPALPTIDIITTNGRTITRMSPGHPHHVAPPKQSKALAEGPKTSREAQHRAEDAVYWIASQLQGLVATQARMKQLQVIYRTQIGLQKASADKEGLYGGESDLYRFMIRKKNGTTVVYAPESILADLGLGHYQHRLLALTVYSLNASRATPVMDTILQLFSAGFDIRHAWIEAAKIADFVNMDIRDGVAPTSQCDCDDSQVSTELHACEGCSRPVVCELRAYDSMGRLVDPRCLARDKIRSRPGQTAGDTLAAFLTYQSLWRSFKKECAIRELDPATEEMKSIFDAAYAKLKKRLPGGGLTAQVPKGKKATEFTDEWSKKTFDVGEERPLLGNNPSRRRYVPHGITVDAIHRQGHPDQHGLKHSGDNTAIATNADNMAHGTFNPGVMPEIATFKRKSDPDQQSHQARKALVQSLTAMAVVNCKRRYINAGQGSAIEKFKKIKNEAVAGRPTPGEPGPWDLEALQYASRNVAPYQPGGLNIWSDEQWERMQKCAQSTEKYFGVNLHRLQDGTIWFGADYTNPANFDRNGVANLLRERQRRMRVVCNKKWITIDTDESLYQEIIFQQCCSMTTKPHLQWLRQKYGDRLGLPLVVFKHTPLRFSVAHRLHGRGMLSAWNPAGPIDVSERIANDDENNLLIESWYVNSAKFDMADEYYETMDDILLSVTIDDKSIYNPAMSFVYKPDAAVPVQGDVDDEDVFTGATFDDPDAPGEDQVTSSAMDLDDPPEGPASAPKLERSPPEEDAGEQVDIDQTAENFRGGISYIYQTIFDNEKLRDLLANDGKLQELMDKLQEIADDPGSRGANERFGTVMGQIQEEYINPLTMSGEL